MGKKGKGKKKSKKDKWAATKDAHVAYEKLLSKFLKEKKAAYKSSQQAKSTTESPAAKQATKPTKEAPKKEAPKKETPKATKTKK